MNAVLQQRPATSRAISPSPPEFARDVLAGLRQAHKSIPCAWLYDARGCELFEAITRLPEYYATRTEHWILQRCVQQIAAAAGPGATLVELGSGSTHKTATLLTALQSPGLYVPIDIAAPRLEALVQTLRADFAGLRVEPLVADFTRLTALPVLAQGERHGRRLVFFPGTTVGNFTPEQAIALLERIARLVGDGALLVVGADACVDPKLLLPAYDDTQGATAAFNKNLLTRINTELGANFVLDAFRHEARWDAQRQRIEMHLVSRAAHSVQLRGESFALAHGESIHTENSYKYGFFKFQALARRAGWTHRQFWTDGQARYGVHVLEHVR